MKRIDHRALAKLKSIGAVMFFLIIVLLAIWGLSLLLRLVYHSIAALDSSVAAAIIAASVTGLISVITVVYGQRRTKERELREAHRPQKVKVYRAYMEVMFDLLKRIKDTGSASNAALPPDAAEKMLSFKRDLILWGSPGVIRAYLEWETVGQADPEKGLLAWARMLREFRKDLGNSNWLLKDRQLLYLILTPESREAMESKKHT